MSGSEEELQGSRKRDKKTKRMEAGLRKDTTMSWSWIAKRLKMGHWRTAANAVRLQTNGKMKAIRPLFIPAPFPMKAVRVLPLICLLFATSNCMLRGLSAEYYHVWKLDAKHDKPILDLDQWAADNFSDAPNAAKDDWKIERFELDIDHDGVPEVFLTSPRLHGNGGGPHLVFQKRGEFYFYGGHLPGRKDTIRVLPVDADGHPGIITFWNDGGGRGTASVWKWDGKGFQRISSEVVWSGDSGTEEGRRRFEELFGKKGIDRTDGEANGSQPTRSETNRTSSAAGSRR